MKGIWFTGICCLLLHMSYAQPSAQDVLAKVSQVYQADKSLQANFSLSASSQGGSLGPAEQGVLRLQGNRYRVDLGDRIFISDGKDQWVVLKEVKEVQLTAVDENAGLTPSTVFNFYKNGYLTEMLDNTRINGINCYVIELKPAHKGQDIQKIQMQVRQDNHRILAVQVWQENGDELQYTMTKQVPNGAMDSKLFLFDSKAYPDMELVDLR